MLGSFNTPRRVLLKESDNLPQVGPTQTSQAAKLIPDSTCLAQDLKIQLGRSFFLFLSAAAILLSGGPLFPVNQECTKSARQCCQTT